MAQHGTEVTARIQGSTSAYAELIFSVAAAAGPQIVEEEINCTLDGQRVELTEIESVHGTRLHKAVVEAGQVDFTYRAVVGTAGASADFDDNQDILYRRPSRYSESDKLTPLGSELFKGLKGQQAVQAVSDWVHKHLSYVIGSSIPTDGAVDTYLARSGVCRDFAHLSVALLRACQLPARLVSVYAPGLSPMDFHAVAEVAVDGQWQVVDATRLAPRQSLVRIATGRDASDTAFLTSLHSDFDLASMKVTAVALDGLPTDDHSGPVSL
ncbi:MULTISPECIES: transglutaminase-like domain-containing protein [Kocuria]|uniref:Transglutaminase family protein n=1 Tax=Kocuria subflava TaxID=1736139 RepID=A0A846TWK4_9MICC|nr:transglutaminase family protein [Kocuria sp. CPCC 104605]NKE09607.1 transglutaminase family protein [Kocuria subflava]